MSHWFVLAGAIALIMAFTAGRVRRMPLSGAIIYLLIGVLLGPYFFGFLEIDPGRHSSTIRLVTEAVIVVSIFSGALKLRVRYRDRRWLDPLRLAFISMVISVIGMSAAGRFLLGLPLGEALTLAAILAPTDPVLASDVQVEQPFEIDRLRFSLTGEAGLNDGSAFPLVTLGLALMGVDPASGSGWKWFAMSVLWGFLGAAAIGTLLGYVGGRYMLHLRLKHHEKLGTDNFLALGLMSLSYGLASLAHSIGFISVFAAGVAVRAVEYRMCEEPPEFLRVRVRDSRSDQEAATDPENAAVFMLIRLQSFTESLEQIGEAVVVVLLGSLIRLPMLMGPAAWLAPALFLVIRPISVAMGLIGSRTDAVERGMISWFGIRGMASVYYLAYLHAKGTPLATVHRLAELVIGVVAYSILVHGITVTPLLRFFSRGMPGEYEPGENEGSRKQDSAGKNHRDGKAHDFSDEIEIQADR